MERSLPLVLALLLLLGGAAGCRPPPAQRLTAADLARFRENPRALVVVHSRSGNTAEMGLALAKDLGADYVRLDVPAGAGDSYLSSPNRKETVDFKVAPVQIARYPLVLLGAPIWWGHPSAFLYSFVRKQDLTGKRVVFFYTYRGTVSDTAVSELTSLVATRGGRLIDSVGINCRDLEGKTIGWVTARLVAEKRTGWGLAP